MLCDLLGLTSKPDICDETSEEQTDLYSQFEAINIDDFKD